MQIGSWEEFDQIQEFTLICSATGASQVNLLPIFHIGKHRIKQLIVLHGRSGNYSEDVNLVQADQFVTWMDKFALDPNGLGLPKKAYHPLWGSADRVFGEWMGAIAQAKRAGLPILCNFTSGTAQMTAALMRGLEGERLPYFAITLDKAPSRVRITGLLNNALAERVLDRPHLHSFVPLVTLIQSKNLEIFESDKGKKKADFYLQNAEAARGIWERFCEDPVTFRPIVAAVNGALSNQVIVNLKQRGGQTFQQMERLFGGSKAWNDGQINGNAVAFFAGGWLEQYVHDRCAEAIAGCEDLQVISGLEINHPKHPPRGETDVVLMERDIPHLIEVKTTFRPDDSERHSKVQPWIDRLSTLRQTLAGVPGRAWIIAPMLDLSAQERDDYVRRAADLQLRLYTGVKAIDQLCENIAEIRGRVAGEA
jgi:hypothetical protein